MTLTDILPLEQWRQFEAELHSRFGLDVNVFNTDGVRISDYKQWVNRLCPEIKATDKGQSYICAVAHMNLAGQAQQSGRPVIEECDAGLVKIVVPIVYNQQFFGAVGACGLLLDDGEVDSFLVNKITDIDEETVDRLAEDIGSISAEKARELVAYVSKRIDEMLAAATGTQSH